MSDYPNARDCEHGQLRRSCERCADAFLIAALEARLAEGEAERDAAVETEQANRDAAQRFADHHAESERQLRRWQEMCVAADEAAIKAERRLAEVEEALLDAKGALDKTLTVLLTVKPNLDRPYPDAPALTPWTRWCEPLARRVDGARRSLRAVLDKGEQPDEAQ